MNIPFISSKFKTNKTQEDAMNPWPGLKPYFFSIKDGKSNYSFCGREKEIDELFSLIDKNVIVTLYGRSGIGKTSLINAGLTKTLLGQSYYPIIIRLGEESDDNNFADIIITKIETLINDKQLFYKPRNNYEIEKEESLSEEIDNLDLSDLEIEQLEESTYDLVDSNTEILLNYLASKLFYNEENGSEVKLVIVLDQFEEIFRKRDNDAKLLLLQLNELTCDNYDGEKITQENRNYRILLGIREDELYLLEEGLDENYIQSMKRNRYRLRNLQDDKAKDVILKPGAYCISEKEKDTIVKNIIEASKGEDGQISSLLLSLICNRLFNKACQKYSAHPIITLEMTRDISKDYLLAFYQEIIYNLQLGNKQRAVIEKLEHNARREPLSMTDFKQAFTDDQLLKLTKGEYGILRVFGEKGNRRIELIHDSFCNVLQIIKQKQSENRKSLVEFVSLFTLYFIILFVDYKFYSYTIAHEMQESDIPTKLFSFSHWWGLYAIIFFPPILKGLIKRRLSRNIYLCLIIASWPIILDIYIRYNYDFYSEGVFSINQLSLPISVYGCCFVLISLCIITPFYTKGDILYHNSQISKVLFFLVIIIYSVLKIFFPGSDLLSYHLLNIDCILFAFLLFTFMRLFGESNIYDLYFFSFMCVLGAFLYGHNGKQLLSYSPSIFINVGILMFLFIIYWTFFKRRGYNFRKILLYSFINILFCLMAYTFVLGYNPLVIKGKVDIYNQQGIWKWGTVIVHNNNSYKIHDALIGKELVSVPFNSFSGDVLIKHYDASPIKYNFDKGLFWFSEEGALFYNYSSLFESKIYRSSISDTVSTIVALDRNLILNNIFSSDSSQYDNNYVIKLHEALSYKEKNDIYKLLRGGIKNGKIDNQEMNMSKLNLEYRKKELSRYLCMSFSSGLLHQAIRKYYQDASDGISDLFYAYNVFVYTHFFDELYNKKVKNLNIEDWDAYFDSLLENVLFMPHYMYFDNVNYLYNELKDFYVNNLENNEKMDSNFKITIYIKLLRMQKLCQITEKIEKPNELFKN